MHAESYDVMKLTIDKYLTSPGRFRVLDVGSQDVQKGKQPTYRDAMRPGWDYTGCDIQDGANVDVVMPSPYTLPFANEQFEVVISGNCLEHVEYPARLVAEMTRVLTFGGVMIIGAPYCMREHRFPLDCWRFLPDGMSVLLRDAGLVVEEVWHNDIDCWGVGTKRITNRTKCARGSCRKGAHNALDGGGREGTHEESEH